MTRLTIVLKTNEGGLWILPQIAEFVRRGATVTVVIPPGAGKLRHSLDAAGIDVVESPFKFSFRPGLRLARDLLRFRRVLKKTAPDVVFYHLYASALACRFAFLQPRRPQLVHMVAGPLYLENDWIRRFERVASRLDSHLIAGSAFTYRAYRNLGLPARRLSAVPYGVDTESFRRGPDQRQELFQVTEGTFVAIMVAYVYAPKGSVFPGVGIKGHDMLLAAWDDFVRKHPDSLLVLAGSGFDEAGEHHRRQLMSARDADDDKVLWLNSVQDVRPLYSSADLSISPSLSENHGAALEASSMSLPSIVSGAGGLPETVTVESGWVVATGNQPDLIAALHDAYEHHIRGGLATKGGQARDHMIANFSVDSSNRQIADIVLRSDR